MLEDDTLWLVLITEKFQKFYYLLGESRNFSLFDFVKILHIATA